MRLFILYIILLAVFVGISCNKNDANAKEKLVQKELHRKMNQFILNKEDECWLNAVIEADIYVDSIIYHLSQFNVLDDSIGMIIKPEDPERPEYIDIIDTIAIVPFITDTLRIKNDSIK